MPSCRAYCRSGSSSGFPKLFHLTPLLLRGSASAGLPDNRRIARLEVFGSGSQILHVVGHELGPDALLKKSDYLDRSVEVPSRQSDDLANPDRARWFRRVSRNADVSGHACRRCERTRLEQPHAPEPFVEPDFRRQVHTTYGASDSGASSGCCSFVRSPSR